MRISMTMLVVLVAGACSGSAPANLDSGRVCNGQLYDSCLQEHDCTSQNCHSFQGDGFAVCSMTCTVGDDTTCGKTLDGRQATCDQGICKPPGPNDCVLMF